MGRKNAVVREEAGVVSETAPAAGAEVKPAAPAAKTETVAHAVAKKDETEHVRACRSLLFGGMPVI